MVNFLKYRSLRGQTALEYLLLLAVTAIVVVAAFNHGGLIDQIQGTAGGYYNTVTEVIMGKNPKAIAGGWCAVNCPPPGTSGPSTLYASCECPPPQFGGAYCAATSQISANGEVTCQGVVSCGPCAPGQVCNAQGQCVCANGLVCGQPPTPKGSITNSTCTSCICPAGTYYDSGTNACEQICTVPCTTWNSIEGKCVNVTCGTNQWCDSNKPPADECQCIQDTYWNGSACVYCPTTSGNQCTEPESNGKGTSCVAYACPPNSYCDTNQSDANYNSCQCDKGTYWKGTQCVPGNCTANPACPLAPNGTPWPGACSTDSCGGDCGVYAGGCPSGETCNSNTPGVPGFCSSNCLSCQSLIGGSCVSTTPCANGNCGTDSCGNACGSNGGGCPAGQTCSSTPGSNLPGSCS